MKRPLGPYLELPRTALGAKEVSVPIIGKREFKKLRPNWDKVKNINPLRYKFKNINPLWDKV